MKLNILDYGDWSCAFLDLRSINYSVKLQA